MSKVLPSDASPLESIQLPASVTRVLASQSFERSPTLRALLTYLWLHRAESISEYAIATEALGRSALFDAKTDATVRVQISRLRQRLEKFYEHEGKDCSERLVVPLGGHQIHSEKVAPASFAVVTPVDPPRPGMPVALALLCACLMLACAGLGLALYRAHADKGVAPVHETPRFWETFFGNGQHSRIILPTPVFLSFSPHPGDSIMFRDTTVNDFDARRESNGYAALQKQMGDPVLAQNYTVASDTFASVKLARYLDRFALETTVLSSADAPLEALDTENVIALGTWGTMRPLKSYLDRMSFVLGLHEQSVQVRWPLPNEPKRIDWVTESPERSVWPGVIAVLPGPRRDTHLLILAARHTSALVSFLTSANGLDQLDRLWKANGSPEYFETVVNSEMNNDELVRFWPVALHGLIEPRNKP
jgi:hypothetical protein